ncbi:hypothetical protein ACFQHW_05410 [Lapidilactobacillus achengensis]|uniref:Uncharacterized protein n=1 Tax=Lapidilactobacillus achengensis TaxID=2486000 RepID=A0ABW1UQ76_9LACO|nr:hypothetical protein [Lapidilactobacillus achengensis]
MNELIQTTEKSISGVVVVLLDVIHVTEMLFYLGGKRAIRILESGFQTGPKDRDAQKIMVAKTSFEPVPITDQIGLTNPLASQVAPDKSAASMVGVSPCGTA